MKHLGAGWVELDKILESLLSSLSGWPRTVAQGMWHVILGFDDDDDDDDDDEEEEEEEEDEDEDN